MNQLLHCLPSFLIHSHINYLLSIFFASQYFFLSSSFRFLNNSLFLHSHIHIFISPPHVEISGFTFRIATDFTRNIQQLYFQTTPIFITVKFIVNPFNKLFFHLHFSQPPHFQFLFEFYSAFCFALRPT